MAPTAPAVADEDPPRKEAAGRAASDCAHHDVNRLTKVYSLRTAVVFGSQYRSHNRSENDQSLSSLWRGREGGGGIRDVR